MNTRDFLYHPIDTAAQMVATMPATEKQVSHVTAVAGVLSGFIDVFPTVLSVLGSILGIVWMSLNIYNHPEVKEWIRKRRQRKDE